MIRRKYLISLFLLVCCGASSVLAAEASRPQLRGNFYTEAYGYQAVDPGSGDAKDHLWLFTGVNATVNNLPGGWKFNSHLQYRGDNVDKYSRSAETRLYAMKLTYYDYDSPWEVNLGRFFLYRGVALGTIDGMEVSREWKSLGFTLIGGTNGPENRRFELAKGSSPFVGGEIRYRMPKWKPLDEEIWKLSYVDQSREGENYRRLLGIQMYGKMNQRWTFLFTTQYRLMSSDIRELTLRTRYYSPKLVGFVEIGALSPEIAANSWFKNFELPTEKRIRGSLDYYLEPAKWGVGAEGTLAMTEGATGFRGGPVVTTPYGQIGYRIASGELSKAYGPWLSGWYNFDKQVDLYVNSSVVDYSWDGVSLVKGQTTSANLGGRYTPKQLDWITFGGEFQYYKTPALNSDNRALGSVTVRFVTGGAK